MKDLYFKNWNKAIDTFIKNYCKSLESGPYDIKTISKEKAGFVVKVDTINYFISFKKCAKYIKGLKGQPIAELKQYFDDVSAREFLDFIQNIWNQNEAAELFLNTLEEAINTNVYLNIYPEFTKQYFKEYAAFFVWDFEQYNPGINYGFPSADKYKDIANEGPTIEDLGAYSVSYVASLK